MALQDMTQKQLTKTNKSHRDFFHIRLHVMIALSFSLQMLCRSESDHYQRGVNFEILGENKHNKKHLSDEFF